jgi:hypothetical protein
MAKNTPRQPVQFGHENHFLNIHNKFHNHFIYKEPIHTSHCHNYLYVYQGLQTAECSVPHERLKPQQMYVLLYIQILHLSRHQNAGQNQDMKICNRCSENVEQFRYLGTT